MDRYQNTSRELGSLIELVVKAMLGIFVVYFIARELISIVAGDLAAKIISVILGLAILFAVVVSKRVREDILHFGKGEN